MATVVKYDPKAPTSLATTPRCRKGATPIPGLLRFNLDPYLIILRVKKDTSSTIFEVFGMTRPWTEPRSLRPLGNILPTREECSLIILNFHRIQKK